MLLSKEDEVIKFPPKTLRELIAFATRIDNHQHQHRKPEYRTETITNTEIPPKPDPDIDKEQRRQYRIANNLCLFCGNPRHQKDTCPKLAKKLASAAAVTIDSITLSPITYPLNHESSNYARETSP